MTHPPSASPALRPCHFVASRLRRARATGWGGRRPPQNGEFYARRSGSGGRQTLLPCHHQPTLLTASGWCTFRVPDWYTFRMPPAVKHWMLLDFASISPIKKARAYVCTRAFLSGASTS